MKGATELLFPTDLVSETLTLMYYMVAEDVQPCAPKNMHIWKEEK